jgi:hypothetical protein
LNVPSYRALYIVRIRELLNTVFAEGPLFRKIDELRAQMEATALLDEAKWPDDLEPLHAGPKRTFAQEIPLMKQNISRRRAHMARVVGIQLEDIPAQTRFLRGDVDGNASVDMADALKLLWFLFLGGNTLDCADAADADDSGAVEITDAIGVLRYLFAGGPTPPAPGPADCGEDSTADALGCDFSACR